MQNTDDFIGETIKIANFVFGCSKVRIIDIFKLK